MLSLINDPSVHGAIVALLAALLAFKLPSLDHGTTLTVATSFLSFVIGWILPAAGSASPSASAPPSVK